MFLPLSQAQAFVIFSLYGLAASHDDLSLEKTTATSITLPTSVDSPVAPNHNATIKLFPASSVSFSPMRTVGCQGQVFNTISLAPETCLSGDYYLHFNMHIDKAPVCSDGKAPTLSYYHARGCSGKPYYDTKTNGKSIPEYCLWGGHSPKYWSLIFHCDAITPTQDEVKHQVAVAPPAVYPEAAGDGVVVTHLFPACNGKRVGGFKPITVPVDRCLTTPGFGVEIKTAAVCANGTRAQWARFSDSKCGYGTIDKTYGLVDLADSDIRKCLSTGTIGAEEKVASMAFWCEGVRKSSTDDDKEKEKKPDDEKKSQAAPGSVSESACMVGKAPFFKHPKTDTCVNLKTTKMKIYSTGVCTNGTEALLASYSESGCAGSPSGLKKIKEADMKSCLDFTDTKSFAFYCTGEGLDGPPSRAPQDGEERQSGSIWGFLMVLLLICLMFFLMLVLSVYAWVRKYGGSVGKLIELVKGALSRKDGAIAL